MDSRGMGKKTFRFKRSFRRVHILRLPTVVVNKERHNLVVYAEGVKLHLHTKYLLEFCIIQLRFKKRAKNQVHGVCDLHSYRIILENP